MDHTSELRNILHKNFLWNKARITCFSQMLLALITTRTVNLNKIACSIATNIEQTSCYRRLQRFLADFSIDFDTMALFIFQLFFMTGEKCYLAMDRTNWMWGESDINILTLAIVFKGIAIPIYWELLDNNGGNSDTQQRIDLMQKFIAQFGKDSIKGLLADREFIGNDWFQWLMNEEISFVIRLKNNLLTTNAQGHVVSLKNLFRDLKPAEEHTLYKKRTLLGQKVYLSGLRLSDGDVLIVATDKNPGLAIKTYGLRWEIETLFSCLKGRGFNFEETHIVHQDRIKKLVALLAIAFSWTHKIGEWRHEIRPIKIKTHGRPAVSIFRYGLDYMVNILTNFLLKKDLFKECLDKLQFLHPDLESLKCNI